MNEPINLFITNFLGPIILIGIILIGFGVMTGRDVSGILNAFLRLIASCITLIFTMLTHILVIAGKFLNYLLKTLTHQVDHAIKQETEKQKQAASQTQWTPPVNPTPPTAGGSNNQNTSKPTDSIKVIYENDPDED